MERLDSIQVAIGPEYRVFPYKEYLAVQKIGDENPSFLLNSDFSDAAAAVAAQDMVRRIKENDWN